MDYKIAKGATKWWIDQMKKRCLELHPDKVIYRDSNLVIIDDSLAKELSIFQDKLFEQILFHIERNLYLSLTCCYWPSGELETLARKSSISNEFFPHRANMQIYGEVVQVSLNGEDLRNLPLPAK